VDIIALQGSIAASSALRQQSFGAGCIAAAERMRA
jgi:hypothetical protein